MHVSVSSTVLEEAEQSHLSVSQISSSSSPPLAQPDLCTDSWSEFVQDRLFFLILLLGVYNVHPPLLEGHQGAFCVVLGAAALAPLPKASPGGPRTGLRTQRALRRWDSIIAVCPVLTRLVPGLRHRLGVVVQAVPSRDAFITDVRVAEVEDLFNIVTSIVFGTVVQITHHGFILVARQAIAVIVVLVIVKVGDDSLPQGGVPVVKCSETMSSLLSKRL